MDKKIKKVRTPLGLIGIKWYISKDGTRWVRFGDGERKRIARGGFLLFKWTTILIIIGVIGWNGYNYSMSYASDKMIQQLSNQLVNAEEFQRMKQDPSVRQLLTEHADELGKEYIAKLGSPKPNDGASSGNQGTNQAEDQTGSDKPANKPAVDDKKGSKLIVRNKEEALKLLLSKFTMKELTDLANSAKGGLTEKKKEHIKDTVMARLTADEFEAVKVVVMMELLKKEG
ncbi:hypothetical protein ACFOQM_11905 [Paenibacillus sp. GCM10012307]|uniref:Uncharacterized protein n=1 Tax=Paenibacillus roseus TaxID=2798579 RepID=A0A934MLB1_9BACL|nr:hypothetical protein [Paenibacillus roseus]MBJ6361990.1 hypothetical protein [Paenibacillus roseus]